MADAPAPTPTPPSDDETVTLTRRELRELTERLATLEAAKDDRRDADTAAEREAAAKAEREAAEKLRTTAHKMGLEPEQVAALRELVADTQRDATREAVREVLAEYDIEVSAGGDDGAGDPPADGGGDPPADPPADGDGTPASSLADLRGKPDAPAPPPPPPDAEPEETPQTTHWFHRPIIRPREKGGE